MGKIVQMNDRLFYILKVKILKCIPLAGPWSPIGYKVTNLTDKHRTNVQ